VLGGRYRLVRLVANGGMASVWEAYDNVLARSVAVKTLHPHLAADRLFQERFRREAVSAARLGHPNVVATYDAGVTPEGTAFIVMELIRGRTLSAFAAEHRPLPFFVCIEIGMQIADALTHAHRAGLVHRDIKPANVLVCDTETDGVPLVKVTDFGIAKAAEGLGIELTKTGMVLGTPKYLSPEQIEGREPDARADLYALGVVLFELVAGIAPFRGPTEMAVAVQHINETPPRLRDVRPGTPPALDALVAALLAKRPEDRPPSAVAVRRALSAIETRGRPRSDAAPGAAPVGPPPTSVGPARPAGPGGHGGTGGSGGFPPPPPRAVATRDATPVGPPLPGRSPTPPPVGAPAPWASRPPSPGATPPRGATSAGSRLGHRPPIPKRTNWAGWVVAALVVAALIVVVVVLANHGSNGARDSSPPTVPASAAIKFQGVSVFDLGSDPDNAATVGYAIDGNVNTSWQTDRYHGPNFGGLYRGLGLALTLDSSQTLHHLVVTSSSDGWSAQVYVADSVPNPATLTPWGPPVTSQQDIQGSTTFNLDGRQGSAVLLWLTNLGPTYQASIAEVSAN